VKHRLNSRFLKLLLLVSFPVLGALIFLPGKSGPLVFDDASNLLGNSYVQITSLDPETLYRASFSLQAGPLKRPVSMLSFALNYYFAGSFDDSTPFKLTNIAIHGVNGLLLFWMLSLVFLRLTQLQPSAQLNTGINRNTYLLLASVVALLWVMHPVQLTSVLYVVQRMTALSGLFTLLALICYLSGRLRIVAGKPRGVGLIVAGTAVFGTLGMLSKETTALLPVYMLVLELTLFGAEQPWRSWHKLPVKMRWALILTGIVATLAIVGWAIHHFLPKYVLRDFGMTERVLTESRILFFYLSLILVPRLDQFSLFHDDIELSTSVLSPWTTLPSLAGIVLLLSLAYAVRRRQPLLSLGIFWFFGGHVLESTILPLELAHEHRNYLPSVGPLLVIVHGIDATCMKLQRRWLWGILPLLVAMLAVLGFMRANQWSNDYSLFLFETLHHPNSASIESGFAQRLIQVGKYNEGMQAFRRAAELDPEEPSYLLFMNMFAANAREKFDQAGANETLRRLATGRITATTGQAMQYLGDCILSWCQSLSPEMEIWMKTLLDRQDQTGVDRSYVNFLLARALVGQGKIKEAIATYNLSHELDTNYLHPLFDLAYLYVREGDGEKARETIRRLQEANQTTRYPKTEQIEETGKEIEKLLNQPRENPRATKRKR
jgi:tetratricopeptide (TPR) repeat protein